MNTIKAKVNKIILALTSVGLLILLILPASLSANHFRYGTMSWDLVDNDTIRLKMENGWTANHGDFREQVDYTGGNGGIWVPGHIGSIKYNYITPKSCNCTFRLYFPCFLTGIILNKI